MNGWRIKPIFQRDPLYVDYVERMAKEMRETIPKRPATIEQCASTQAILDRPESEDAAWQARPLPTWEQAGAVPFTKDPNDMSFEELDALVGRRDLDPQDVAIITRLRGSGRGHTFGDAVSEGAKGTTEEARERAVNALTFSPPAILTDDDRRRITALTEIKPPPPTEPEPEKTGKKFGRVKFWWGLRD